MTAAPNQTATTASTAAPAVGSAVPTPDVGALGGSLVLVILLVVAGLWAFKRLSGGSLGARGPLAVRGSVAVGQRERVVWLQAGDKQYLVGVAPGSVNLLQALDADLTPDAESAVQHGGAGASAPNFRDILNRSLGRS